MGEKSGGVESQIWLFCSSRSNVLPHRPLPHPRALPCAFPPAEPSVTTQGLSPRHLRTVAELQWQCSATSGGTSGSLGDRRLRDAFVGWWVGRRGCGVGCGYLPAAPRQQGRAEVPAEEVAGDSRALRGAGRPPCPSRPRNRLPGDGWSCPVPPDPIGGTPPWLWSTMA